MLLVQTLLLTRLGRTCKDMANLCQTWADWKFSSRSFFRLVNVILGLFFGRSKEHIRISTMHGSGTLVVVSFHRDDSSFFGFALLTILYTASSPRH